MFNRLIEVLEFLATLERRGEKIELKKVAEEFNITLEEAEKIINEAIEKGFIKIDNGEMHVSNEGLTEVLKHRESYIHARYGHKTGFLGRVTRFIEGKIDNFNIHWQNKHGFNGNSLDAFYKNIQSLEGYIEETRPLTTLKEGEKAIIVYALGGKGLIKRLSEMGLTPGTEILVRRAAPFYGPIQIAVRGVSLALGRGVASKIFVKNVK